MTMLDAEKEIRVSRCSCQVLAARWVEWLVLSIRRDRAIMAAPESYCSFDPVFPETMTTANDWRYCVSRRMRSFFVSSVLGFSPFPVRARDSKRRSECDGYARNVALKGSNLVGIPNQSRLGAVQWPSSTSSNLLCPSRSNNILFCTMPCSIY